MPRHVRALATRIALALARRAVRRGALVGCNQAPALTKAELDAAKLSEKHPKVAPEIAWTAGNATASSRRSRSSAARDRLKATARTSDTRCGGSCERSRCGSEPAAPGRPSSADGRFPNIEPRREKIAGARAVSRSGRRAVLRRSAR